MSGTAVHYRPILLAKQGERAALQLLSAEEHEQFTPVFVIPPRSWNYENDGYSKSLEQHLEKVPAELASCRPHGPVYVDLVFLNDETEDVYGSAPLTWLSNQCSFLGLTIVPVVSLSSSEGICVAAREISAAYDTGVGLRLLPDEWPSLDPKAFYELLQELGVSTIAVDLILDLGSDTGSQLAFKAPAPEVEWVRKNGPWRSVTIGGSGMPKDPPTGSGVHELERHDWLIYKRLMSLHGENFSGIDYADYGVAGTEPSIDVNPRFLNISASYRYATEESWLLARGGLYKANGGRSLGGAAVAPMLQHLVAHGSYGLGPRNQSHDWIESVLAGASGGTPAIWRKWATLHHLKTVLNQLASLNGPSSSA